MNARTSRASDLILAIGRSLCLFIQTLDNAWKPFNSKSNPKYSFKEFIHLNWKTYFSKYGEKKEKHFQHLPTMSLSNYCQPFPTVSKLFPKYFQPPPTDPTMAGMASRTTALAKYNARGQKFEKVENEENQKIVISVSK